MNKYKELRLIGIKLSRKFLQSDYLAAILLDSNLGREHFSIDNGFLENKKVKKIKKKDYQKMSMSEE